MPSKKDIDAFVSRLSVGDRIEWLIAPKSELEGMTAVFTEVGSRFFNLRLDSQENTLTRGGYMALSLPTKVGDYLEVGEDEIHYVIYPASDGREAITSRWRVIR